MPSKSFWKSKTLWFNLLSIAAEVTQIVPLPPGTVTVVSNIINIGLRTITKQPVHVTQPLR